MTKKLDGLGNELVPDASYYVQDTRTVVGNCGLWWADDSQGYCCDINKAGLYTGNACAKMRETDVPWPKEHVLAHCVMHVRVDTRFFERRDRIERKADDGVIDHEGAVVYGVDDGGGNDDPHLITGTLHAFGGGFEIWWDHGGFNTRWPTGNVGRTAEEAWRKYHGVNEDYSENPW